MVRGMSNSTLYDDDILLWSEQQAAAIRKLGRSPEIVPNDLDIENVAEEIESVGRSELAAVESFLQLVLAHLIKLVVTPDATSARHWRSEIFHFSSQARRRYAPSMRQRIDLDAIWRSAKKEMRLQFEGEQEALVEGLPEAVPYLFDELLSEEIDGYELVRRLRP
jgi:hypothetical protein